MKLLVAVVIAFSLGYLAGAWTPRPAAPVIPAAVGDREPDLERQTEASEAASAAPTPHPTPKPTPKPTPRPTPTITAKPRQSIALTNVETTWYCEPGVSICTAGYPASCLCAAASRDLHWRGKRVRVSYGGRSVTILVVDCLCSRSGGLDLYGSAFAKLAPLSSGVIYATARVVG